MVLLARIGLINSAMLRTNRKYIGFGMLVVGAVLAPDGSPITMMLLAGPDVRALRELDLDHRAAGALVEARSRLP